MGAGFRLSSFKVTKSSKGIMGNVFGCNSTAPGNGGNTDSSLVRQNSRHFTPILDNYNSLEEVVTALRKAGLQSSDMIIGIDFTKSYTLWGKR